MSLTLPPSARLSHHEGVVSWQRTRARKVAAGTRFGALLTTVCAVAGGAATAGQALGVLHWKGPAAFIPAGMALAAVASLLVVAARASLRWLAEQTGGPNVVPMIALQQLRVRSINESE